MLASTAVLSLIAFLWKTLYIIIEEFVSKPDRRHQEFHESLYNIFQKVKSPMHYSTTIGELRKANYTVLSVKDEIRKNLVEKLDRDELLFPGIIGYEETVIPALTNAILAKHDIMLLGLRGQAKTRIVRQLPGLLDEYIPVIEGC